MINRLLTILFLVAFSGVIKADTFATEDRTFSAFNAADGLADNSAQSIVCTFTGRLVISTIGQINFYDGVSFSHISSEDENKYYLSNYTGHYHMLFDHAHHLWLKNHHQIVCVNLTTERFIYNVDSVFRSMGIRQRVQDLFVDEYRMLWVMVGGKIYNPKSHAYYPILKGKTLQDAFGVGKQLVEVYSDGMIATFDLKSRKLLFCSAPYSKEKARYYAETCVAKNLKNGFFQIINGVNGHSILLYFNMNTRQWTTIMDMPYHLNNIKLHDCYLFIPSEYGYWKYCIATGKKLHVAQLKRRLGGMLQTDINAIEFDSLGGMWLGTEKRGLLYAKSAKEPFVAYTWEQPEAMYYSRMMDRLTYPNLTAYNQLKAKCLLIDSRGWTWIGTQTGLILRRKGMADRVFTMREGLFNDVIHAVIEDNMHNIWLSTSYGITCLIMKNGRLNDVLSYNDRDNVPAESFVDGRAMKLRDGTIVMQAIDHVVKFDPGAFTTLIRKGIPVLHPKLVKLMVNGNFITTGKEYDGNVILPKAVTRTFQLNLKYNQNTVALTFSGFNYFRPLQTYYRIRVIGLDNKWHIFSYFNSKGMVDSKGTMHLPLAGLDAGTYTVQVQASLYPDSWNSEPLTLTINVKAPWWRTTGIVIMALLLIVALIVLNILFYKRVYWLRVDCTNGERDIISRINSYLERCEAFNHEVLTRDWIEKTDETETETAAEFNKLMLELMPYFKNRQRSNITMEKLRKLSGISIPELLHIISDNIYKSPYYTMRQYRLEHSRRLLKEGVYSISDVASMCKFSSVNFFISCFYHQYRMTPKQYVENLAKQQ